MTLILVDNFISLCISNIRLPPLGITILKVLLLFEFDKITFELKYAIRLILL